MNTPSSLSSKPNRARFSAEYRSVTGEDEVAGAARFSGGCCRDAHSTPKRFAIPLITPSKVTNVVNKQPLANLSDKTKYNNDPLELDSSRACWCHTFD
ncbi:hypothetical protein L1987_11446 [Smallanthus sonchifolius]|uniref:Uncharacterized protein n=1 Tax=Smallanthus sonchifolius TaxID=185202 RepID=A0ACB9JBJ4_9ASTR|nr:hypothetical protein L1987_11446 [Smallanthus sonchifolius]